MLRTLGQSEYGLYNLVASFVAYLGVLNFGFSSAYMRYYSRYKSQDDKEKISKLNGIFLIIFSIIGAITIVAGTALALNTDLVFGSKLTAIELSRAKVMTLVLVFNLAISFPFSIFSSHITANEKFIFQNLLQIVYKIASPLIMLPVLLMGYGSIGMVISSTVINILIQTLNSIYCFKNLKIQISFKHLSIELVKEMTVFSFFIFINMIVDQINWNIDKYLLGRFRGTIAVAVYGLAAQLNVYFVQISYAISSVFIPRVHNLVVNTNNNIELSKLFARIGRLQFLILTMILTGLIFFGRPFIKLWAGDNYDESYPIILILTISIFVDLIQNIGIEIQRAKNIHQFRSWLYLFIAIGNLGISIPLVKAYGGIGAALGTGISIIIGNEIIMNLYYHFKVGLDMKKYWKEILKLIPALIFPVSAGILIKTFFCVNNITSLLGLGTIYVIIYCFSMWHIGMNSYEKDLIKIPITKLFDIIMKKRI